MRIGALEAGGTKMVCAIGNENGEILKREVFPTTTPDETMPLMIHFFQKEEIEALGIGCFGPIDPRKGSKTYGYITSTPKLKWQNYNIVGEFEKALGCPVGFDTDVNAAALGACKQHLYDGRHGYRRGCIFGGQAAARHDASGSGAYFVKETSGGYL